MSPRDWPSLGPALVAVGWFLAFAAPAEPPPQSFDVLIINGHVIDGTGSPWYAADVGIVSGRIAAIGHLSGVPAARLIDAQGRVVAPGFIDMLGQSELSILIEPSLPSKVFQGITTQITGEGGSVAPLNDATLKADRETFADLVDKGYLPKDRAKSCRVEYGELNYAFQQLIKPNLDPDLTKKAVQKSWLPDATARPEPPPAPPPAQ